MEIPLPKNREVNVCQVSYICHHLQERRPASQEQQSTHTRKTGLVQVLSEQCLTPVEERWNRASSHSAHGSPCLKVSSLVPAR